jgi:hypothetical protein
MPKSRHVDRFFFFPHLRHDKKNIPQRRAVSAFRCGCFFIYEFGKHAWKIPLTVPNESRARTEKSSAGAPRPGWIGTKIDFCTDELKFVPFFKTAL